MIDVVATHIDEVFVFQHLFMYRRHRYRDGIAVFLRQLFQRGYVVPLYAICNVQRIGKHTTNQNELAVRIFRAYGIDDALNIL